MCVFLGARVGIGRELGGNCSHSDLLHDVAGIEPTCFFAFSYLWSELYALFNKELEGITVSQAADMLERRTPAVFAHEAADANSDVMSDFQVALRLQNVAPRLALQIISPAATLDISAAGPEAASAMRQLQQSKHAFVKHASQIIGSRELLLSNWFQRMGGRVLAAVTGGGHTSDDVLAWMQVRADIFAPFFSRPHDFAGSFRFQNDGIQGARLHMEKLLRILRVPWHQPQRPGFRRH